ncbi:MAG TPA: septal ring lytic transglycosylase RlpA family protein [Nitrospiria bacterium]|nr:septal ring lytic transglycosylase RlpA family protein [Nitrospiria bacterium]
MKHPVFMPLSGFILAMAVVSCASIPRSRLDYPVGYRESGIASWYGEEFQGRPTANGETYNMYAMTAAHRLMPLGTTVKVTRRETGQSVMVRVNDRGPFVRGRILDLSYGAARALGMTGTGTAPVLIEVVFLPKDSSMTAGGLFTVQAGAFEVEENAKQLAERLRKKYPDVYLMTMRSNQSMIYRVRVGLLGRKEVAFELAERLSREERLDPFVTRKDP